jgi:Zn-dependent peptidase ImmA (M78 family)
MKWVPRKLLDLGWNRRPLTQEDFDLCCSECGVEVVELPIPEPDVGGIYLMRRGLPVIIINEAAGGLRRLFAEFEELAHHLLHSPDVRFSLHSTESKLDNEAKALAVCALIPEPTLRRMLQEGMYEDDCFPHELLAYRVQVLETYHI